MARIGKDRRPDNEVQQEFNRVHRHRSQDRMKRRRFATSASLAKAKRAPCKL